MGPIPKHKWMVWSRSYVDIEIRAGLLMAEYGPFDTCLVLLIFFEVEILSTSSRLHYTFLVEFGMRCRRHGHWLPRCGRLCEQDDNIARHGLAIIVIEELITMVLRLLTVKRGN